MQTQAIINIGCLGSVSDGKSTLVRELTGKETQTDSREKVRNITIKQGYANMKVWYNGNKYKTTHSDTNIDDYDLVSHISWVDCPGHQTLIDTTFSSITLMDGAIIVVAVDQPLTMKPQLEQHLLAAKQGGLTKIIICMNKIDLVEKEVLMKRKKELDTMLQKYSIVPYVIIPTCFNKGTGTKHLVTCIMNLFNPNEYIAKAQDDPFFRICRTFDVNKPGTNYKDVVGGVIGGTLFSGKLKVGDKIEIRPGVISKGKTGNFTWEPIITNILSIKTEATELDEIIPGGMVGLGTDIDPYYCKNNALIGHVVGLPNTLPDVFTEISIKCMLLSEYGYNWEPKVKDSAVLQIGTRSCDAELQSIKKNMFKFTLKKPVCIKNNEHVIISRNIDKILKIVATGNVNY